jgi:hypothetical protein
MGDPLAPVTVTPVTVAKGTDQYIVDSEGALKPLPDDDPTITPYQRALIASLNAIAQAILALVKKK